MLSGYKTYIIAVLVAAYSASIYLGLLPNDPALWGLLGAGGMAALRAAV